MANMPGDRQRREREHFDQLADTHGEIWWGSTTQAGLRRLERRAAYIKETLAELEDPSVLEMGCGTGALTKPLLEALPELRLTGYDVSPRTIDVIRERYAFYPHARFEVADATALPYAASSFDAVVGNAILHHVPLEASLRECLRVLKPGGIIWFSEPNMLNPQVAIEKNIHFIGKILQNSEDETAFFRWRLAAALRHMGFERVSVEPYDFLHPITPAFLIGVIDSLGKFLEHVPLVREISGSLRIHARKPHRHA